MPGEISDIGLNAITNTVQKEILWVVLKEYFQNSQKLFKGEDFTSFLESISRLYTKLTRAVYFTTNESGINEITESYAVFKLATNQNQRVIFVTNSPDTARVRGERIKERLQNAVQKGMCGRLEIGKIRGLVDSFALFDYRKPHSALKGELKVIEPGGFGNGATPDLVILAVTNRNTNEEFYEWYRNELMLRIASHTYFFVVTDNIEITDRIKTINQGINLEDQGKYASNTKMGTGE